MIKLIRQINHNHIHDRIIQRFQLLILISTLFTICIFQTACNSTGQNVDEEKEVIAALDKFLRAFEIGNFEVMEASFAEDAYVFPRAIMSNDNEKPIDNANYRRIKGKPPTQMKQLINRLRESGKQPPYLTHLNPKDLKITMFTNGAVATFHLENGNSLSRRTIIFTKNDGVWKIIHIHPSNVVSSE